MLFYKKCLGGKLTFNTVGQFSESEKMSGKMKECIVNATLANENLVLIGTDMPTEKGLIRGNSVSLLLNCKSEQEMKRCYVRLSAGGVRTRLPEFNFDGALFGTLTDKFGNDWLLNYTKKEN
jgi:PhnB protein